MCTRVYCQIQFIYLSHPNVSHWMSVNKLDLDATCPCALVYCSGLPTAVVYQQWSTAVVY